MSEVKRYHVTDSGLVEGQALGRINVVLGPDYDSAVQCFLTAAEGCVAAERRERALQARLTAADEENDALKGLAVKQAALLDELGIPLDEVDDLFGETLKNAKRYEYVRSVMAVENFPAPHPAWSEPSEVESKRIDDLCDAALKPAEPAKDEHVCTGCGSKGWTANCAECVPY